MVIVDKVLKNYRTLAIVVLTMTRGELNLVSPKVFLPILSSDGPIYRSNSLGTHSVFPYAVLYSLYL